MSPIPQHRHCKECGLAVVKDREFCSDECRNKYELSLKKKKNSMLVYYICLIIAVVLLILMLAGR